MCSYRKYRWIIRHRRRCRLGLLRSLFNPEILYVAATEYDVFVRGCGRRNFVFTAAAALGAKGLHIFERDGRLFGVDLDERAYVSRICQ